MDDSIKLIEAQYGLKGFAIIVKLWQDIYSSEGYFKKFDKDIMLLFSKEINVPYGELREFMQVTFSRGIFNREMFDRYRILTSAEIQTRFLKCIGRRKKVEIISEYVLCDLEGYENISLISAYKKAKNVCKTLKNDDILKQSKVKESKVKESKEEESKNAPAPDKEKLFIFGEFKNVELSEREKDELINEMGEEALEEYAKKVDLYIEESGKKYKNVALVIRRWYREDKDKRARAPSVKKSKFSNYTDTSKQDYDKAKSDILEEFLKD